ncbi:nuclease-related domain-containing protein [Lysinibacillus sp. LZ02]|uniref:nuclease-related domain-containing protein n=1 Tax=Lysinibacillus sp. LZ02 TaxID=3420668 RepID=UPI003D364322
MILIERDESFKISTLQAGVRRGLMELRDLLYRAESGLVGEQYVDRMWHDFQLKEPYYLLHNYCISQHQIDTVFICSRFILIVEIKNISGRITFEEEKSQFLREWEDGTIESFRNPIDQVKRHVRYIDHLIDARLPIFYAVVFAHPRTIIGRIPLGEPVFKLSGLETFVRKLLAQCPEKLNPVHLEQFALSLAKKHQVRKETVQIEVSRVMPGVLCSKCTKGMKFQHGKFICLRCNQSGLEDFYVGLADYRYLISEWISNQELRRFFHISSEDAARRLLKNLAFDFTGTYKDRKYRICLEKLNSRVNR